MDNNYKVKFEVKGNMPSTSRAIGGPGGAQYMPTEGTATMTVERKFDSSNALEVINSMKRASNAALNSFKKDIKQQQQAIDQGGRSYGGNSSRAIDYNPGGGSRSSSRASGGSRGQMEPYGGSQYKPYNSYY
ncbi:uncharacterized protein LOC132200313 [Neocloeon triangulifer]|uniref:uncharacterized protein LOC132200313 n=1 Tax=Neocloeon triangulifer TaxID=2078957 RepID=UPI00286ECA02|nr:uncharacterized protein LOC132200313 [Neocloeon triangulifer]